MVHNTQDTRQGREQRLNKNQQKLNQYAINITLYQLHPYPDFYQVLNILEKNWRSVPSFDSSCGGLARFAHKIVCFSQKVLALLACLIHNPHFWYHGLTGNT